jgi:type II secretory pathway pseudopilin PulG
MEAVVALGVIAVAVPLILSATAVSTRTRTNAETDTRSAWLARTVQQELTNAWRDLPSPLFPVKPSFPTFGSPTAPEVLLFDADGQFLARGTSDDFLNGVRNPRAVYLLSVHAQKQNPANLSSNDDLLSRVEITVAHPAQGPRPKRITCSYTVLIPRQTAP